MLLKGSSGFYCYAIFEHAPEYPALNVSVARLAFKLNAAMYGDTHLPVLLFAAAFSY